MRTMKTVTVDGKTYPFDDTKMTNRDAIVLEEYTGWGLSEWMERVSAASGKAITFLVWYVRKQEQPGLLIGDVEFNMASLDLGGEDEPVLTPKEPEDHKRKTSKTT